MAKSLLRYWTNIKKDIGVDVVAHWFRFGGQLVAYVDNGHVVAHWFILGDTLLEMWWLNSGGLIG